MWSRNSNLIVFICFYFGSILVNTSFDEPQLGSARVVFQTNYGDIEFGFFPTVAPKTVDHLFKLVRLGCYNTNHFFRVDKGFVAQVADVMGGRSAPMNEEQRLEAEKTVIGEFSKVKHVRGILSMGRIFRVKKKKRSSNLSVKSEHENKNEITDMTILTVAHPHFLFFLEIPLIWMANIPYLVKLRKVMRKRLEERPTRREGIFVMPMERITIMSSYYYDTDMKSCEQDRSILKRRLAASAVEVERWKMRCFA